MILQVVSNLKILWFCDSMITLFIPSRLPWRPHQGNGDNCRAASRHSAPFRWGGCWPEVDVLVVRCHEVGVWSGLLRRKHGAEGQTSKHQAPTWCAWKGDLGLSALWKMLALCCYLTLGQLSSISGQTTSAEVPALHLPLSFNKVLTQGVRKATRW